MSRMRPERSTTTHHTVPDGRGATLSLLPIGADLLPQKASAGRAGRGRRLGAIAVVLVAVVAVAGAYLFSLQARSTADGDLAAAQDQQRSLQVQRKSFDELVRTQALDQRLRGALGTIMATDTSWASLLTGLAKIDGGIDFSAISANLTDPKAPAATTSAPTTPGEIGTLTMSGAAADKPTIAAFVEALDGLTGLDDPFLSTVTAVPASVGAVGGYSFTVTVAITGDLQSAASGRWATTTGGGK